MEFLNAYCENSKQDCFLFLTNEMPLAVKIMDSLIPLVGSAWNMKLENG